jgi:uncharacterized delta-60 repeat protein
VLVGGSFDHYDGVEVYGIARANADGSIDPTFDPGSGTNNGVQAIALQPNGKVLVAGGFDSYNGTTRWHIARANPDGSLDTTFDPGAGTDELIAAMVLQPNGKILIGGNFTTYDTVSRNGIARVNGLGFFLFMPVITRNS